MSISITQKDFKGLGQVATHCNLPKLEIAINEAILFDLEPLLCNMYGEVSEKWRQQEGAVADIVCAKIFDNCQGFKTHHIGLRKVLTYFAYARYLVINANDDTPGGTVVKSNDFSIPKSAAEIKAYSTKYKNMGAVSMEKIQAFILMNIDDYPGYPKTHLKGCGCNGTCGTTTNTKGFGIRSKTVYK